MTWAELRPLGDFGGLSAMASLLHLKNGDYAGFFHDDGSVALEKAKSSKRAFFRETSYDGGKTWTEPKELGEVPEDVEKIKQAEKEQGRFRIFKTVLRDRQSTWDDPVLVTDYPNLKLGEPAALYSPNRKEIALLMRENSREYNSFVMFSKDETETWTEPRQLPWTLTGDWHQSKYAKDGRLLITFRDMATSSPYYGDWVLWVGTYEDIKKEREGQYRIRLIDNKGDPSDTGYAGLEVLPDGTIVTTSYCRCTEREEPYIVSVRFTLEEIDEKARRAP